MKKPSSCPYCHLWIDPIVILAEKPWNGKHYWMFQCTDESCRKCFIGEYERTVHGFLYQGIPRINKRKKNFSEIIKEISPNFENIYNQAYTAEQDWLDEISWGWFRKALEFLIKDYLVHVSKSDKESIEWSLLGKYIEKYVLNENIKIVAKRAAWLWNDEIHYIRKWETKDLQDLKMLIDLTVNWIEMEIQTERLLNDMPG